MSSFVFVKGPETEEAVLVKVFIDGQRIGMLAMTKLAWAEVEQRGHVMVSVAKKYAERP